MDDITKEILDYVHADMEKDFKEQKEREQQEFNKICSDNGLVDMEKKILSTAVAFTELANECSGDMKKTFDDRSKYLRSLLTKKEFNYIDLEELKKINKEKNYYNERYRYIANNQILMKYQVIQSHIGLVKNL